MFRTVVYLRTAAVFASVATATAVLAFQADSNRSGPRVSVEPSFVAVTDDGRFLLRYRYKGAPKPYVKELLTPAGTNVLLDSPPDHRHHRGLMFAVAAGGVNFWEETAQSGRQVHRALEPVRPEPGTRAAAAAFTEQLDWLAPEGKLLLRERRTIRVHGDKEAAAAGVALLTWETCLALPRETAEATLTGNHYFGLGMRFVHSMDKVGRFLNAANAKGEVFRGDERLTPAKWCAYASAVDGKPVTVAMFDHPDNARHPATWFTMQEPFAYLSATMKLHEQPLTLKREEPLTLCYGVALWDGHVDAARIEGAYDLWLRLLTGEGGPRLEPAKARGSEP